MKTIKRKNVWFTSDQADVLTRASRSQGLSLSDWLRTYAVTLAAEQLGVPVPKSIPTKRRGRPLGEASHTIAEAARLLGMSVPAFKIEMARRAAESTLSEIYAKQNVISRMPFGAPGRAHNANAPDA